MENYDAVVIGGGVVGCGVATHLRRYLKDVVVIERESAILTRASYVNQARVHNGYHYPRSLLTALRSRINFPRFVAEFEDCIDRDFDHYYAIARNFSNVSADQFVTFCRRVGAPVEPAPEAARRLFDAHMIEDVFQVEEFAFDSHKLAARLYELLRAAAVEVLYSTTAERVSESGGRIIVSADGPDGRRVLSATTVFNCTYSRTNVLLGMSGLSIIPLKHELTELVLLEMPRGLETTGVTVMCGPFFSAMPFPSRHLHSLHHVRYTPHRSWQERDLDAVMASRPEHGPTRFDRMVRDAARYLPALADCRHVESLWETKTVLPASELDDSRPILFRRDEALPNVITIVGGKIDNIFDVFAELDHFHQAGGLS